MSQDRKYFGMTVQQVGILAGLVGLVCLLIVVVGWLALRGRLGFFSRSSAPTLAVQPTSTKIAIPTSTPTETPTPVPYEQLIPYGWIQHKTQLIELWMPPDFTVAAPGVVSGVAGSAVYINLALVSASGKSGYPASVSVSYEPMTSATLEEFLDVRLSNIPPDINRAEQKKISINSTEAYRLMFESHSNSNLNINDLLFIIQDGSTVWYVKYSAEITEFYELLPFFEESIKTFRMVQ